MGRSANASRIELLGVFRQMQKEMLARLASGSLIGHAGACGASTEYRWLDLLRHYLPQRYCASSAFIVDADGRRSRQIDIAIYDRLYSPLLFPHESGLHVPAEAVYAVFEVKHVLNAAWVRDAGVKAASVRRLRRTSVPVLAAGSSKPAIKPRPVLAGVLAPQANWADFRGSMARALSRLSGDAALDLGCVLEDGAFEAGARGKARFSTSRESLVFFILRLLDRLRAMGTAPAADLMAYGRSLESFRR